LAYAITKGYTVPTPDAFAAIGQGYLGLIPLPVIYMVVVGLIFGIFLGRTVTGRRIYALGGNEEAAEVSGININRIKCLVYVLAGVMAAAGGIVCAARLGVAQSTLGLGYELDVIAAVYIGGASSNGGSGTVLGAILGAAIMGVIRNGLVLLDVSPYWVQFAIGSIIVIAVAIDQFRAKYQQKQQLKEVKG
jgi:ribose transport system permease protein